MFDWLFWPWVLWVCIAAMIDLRAEYRAYPNGEERE
jgi:hypothetical protein